MTRLADLAGKWWLNRVIEDARAGETGQLTGTASFADQGEYWLYAETGTLVLPGREPLAASREYRFFDNPDGAEVCFADGRPFHAIRWDQPEAVHECPPDLYRVRYDFTGFPRWQAVWQVTGPRKDYIMTSTYSRS